MFYSLSHFIGDLDPFAGWLGTNASQKVCSLTQTIVEQFGNLNGFRVQNFDTSAADAVTFLRKTVSFLRRWRLKFFRYVNITEIILIVEIIDGEPLDFGYFLVVG